MTIRVGNRIAAVDVGIRKVGVALADPLAIFAQPVGTFPPSEAIAVLKRLDQDDGLETVVVGWPLDDEGKEGPATKMVNEYVRRVRNAVKRVRIVRWDEGYTSEEASSRLGVTRKDKERVDTLAAGIILQEYLDSLTKVVAADRGTGND